MVEALTLHSVAGSVIVSVLFRLPYYWHNTAQSSAAHGAPIFINKIGCIDFGK